MWQKMLTVALLKLLAEAILAVHDLLQDPPPKPKTKLVAPKVPISASDDSI